MSDGWKRPDKGKCPDHVYPRGVVVAAAVQSHSIATTVADVMMRLHFAK